MNNVWSDFDLDIIDTRGVAILGLFCVLSSLHIIDTANNAIRPMIVVRTRFRSSSVPNVKCDSKNILHYDVAIYLTSLGRKYVSIHVCSRPREGVCSRRTA